MRLSINIKALYISTVVLFLYSSALAQGNCDLMAEGSKERLACEYGRKAITFKQGSRESQQLFDSAIAVNPDYAWAYYEKSVPYFKRGMLTEGIKLLNKAVELDPLSHLTYRAYWFFQHKSYALCRDDLERFYGMKGSYDKNTPGGGLDMRILLGIVYSELGADMQAVEQVEETIKAYPSEDFVGPYDYHTLGVLYLKNEQFDKAKTAFLRSFDRNEQFADTYYYMSLASEKLGELTEAKEYILEALLRFEGKKNGYSGYPICFPITQKMAMDLNKVLFEDQR